MDVRTAVARVGEWPHWNIASVRLDGVEQVGVQEVDFSKGAVTRGKRFAEAEEPGPGQVAIGKNRYVFQDGDFVLETVVGKVEVEWRDKARAKRWLQRHGINAEPTA